MESEQSVGITGNAQSFGRMGLGCMRLLTEMAGDPDLGPATIAAALDAGIAVFDTCEGVRSMFNSQLSSEDG
jgi:aryl-alcohol dehydrogenase-like predicted oxidoreductase